MVRYLESREQIVRFSVFELDRRSGELRKAGVRIALQDHSFKILERLLERPGDLVTRDELRALLWPADTFVDFERGLNTAVRRLRDALGDAADTPRFVETLPRRGYRFIAPMNPPDPTGERRPPAEPTPRSRRAPVALLMIAILVAAALVATMLIAARKAADDPSAAPVVHLLASVQPADQLLSAEIQDREPSTGFGRPSRTAIALSPDGRQVVFSARRGDSQMLYQRPLDRPEAIPIANTEGGDSPFFSPDGRWIGFWADGRIRKVPAGGGPAITIADLAPPPRAPSVFGSTDPPLYGASWGSDDVIVFGLRSDGLWQVPVAGGTPARLTALAPQDASHRLPHVLPGAAAVLFTARTRRFGEGGRIEAYVRATGERKILIDDGADARYLATGHLIFARRGTLLAVPFDAARLELTGNPVGMVDGVMQAALGASGRIDTSAAQFTVSDTGTLAYVAGGVYPRVRGRLVWVDRRGRIEPIGAEGGLKGAAPRLSPDGRQVAFHACPDPAQACPDIWTYDLERHRLTRLTFGAAARFPIWTPDGRRIAFASDRGGGMRVFWIPADGSEPAAPLIEGDDDTFPADWDHEGDRLVFARRVLTGQWDLWALDAGSDLAEARPVARTQFDEMLPAVSPDGRWLAYVSTESGRADVYAQRFPGPGPKHRISTNGGYDPIWARDGRELFFTTGSPNHERMVAVSIRTEPELTVGSVRTIFEMGRFQTTSPVRAHDLGSDGRFLMVLLDDPPPASPVTFFHVVLNWGEVVKAKAKRSRLRATEPNNSGGEP